MTKTPKRPRDPNQLAKFITDMATGEIGAALPSKTAVRAQKAGSKGGPARAKALSAEDRARIASIAASARWKKSP